MWLSLLTCSFLLVATYSTSTAQIVLDGSLGPSGTLSGPDVTIPADVGRRLDTNLFHSFREFNLPTGGQAMFTGPDAIENILGRVTGGSPSSIDGRIGSDIPNVNLFLFNPSGMLFGPNAALDLDGSFSASTADFLRLADGAIFSADLSRDSQLSSAPLAAFGFWRSNPTSMTIEGSTLEVTDGATLSLVAGDTSITDANLRAPGGRLHLVSTASAGDVIVGDRGEADTGPTVAHQGGMEVVGSRLDVSSDQAGRVVIEGGRFLLDRSRISAQTRQPDTDGAALGIDIAVTGEMVVRNGSIIEATALDAGHPGDIRVHVGSLTLDGGEIGNAIPVNFPVSPDGDPPGAFATNNGGSVTVVAREAITLDDGIIASMTPGDPDARDIHIEAPTIRMQRSVVLTPTGAITVTADGPDLVAGGIGNPGNINIIADTLDITGGSIVYSGTFGGSGEGGNLLIQARHITVADQSLISTATTGEGKGGTVTIKADTLTLTGVSDIESDTNAGGDGGEVIITANEVSLLQDSEISSDASGGGNGGEVILTVTGALNMTGDSEISSNARDGGQGGNVLITAGELNISLFSQIASDVTGTGNGGNVTVIAGEILVDLAEISSETFGSGNAGAIRLEADRIRLINFAQIDSDSERDASGRAGEITVSVGTLEITRSEIDSTSRGTGEGGRIELHATEAILMRDGGRVITNATSRGVAGSIMIDTSRLEMDRGRLAATASLESENRGGNITVQAPEVRLTDSTMTTAARSEAGSDGGDIAIQQAVFVIVDASEIRADAFGGNGGNIRIEASNGLLITSTSIVDASSELGLQGQIDFRAPVTIISDSVEPLPQAFVQVAKLLQARCESRLQDQQNSTFIVSGREGVPVEPGEMLPSPPSFAQPGTNDERTTRGSPAMPTAVARGQHEQTEVSTSLARACSWWQTYRNKLRSPAS